jgi:hypothetical protein
MSAAEMQACMGRLCVDGSFRRLFELEGAATLVGYRLTAGEQEALLAIDRRRLAEFAGGLRAKRQEQLGRGYPLLARALPPSEQKRWFDRFYDLHPADPGDSPLEGRLRFGRFLEESLSGDPDAPPYASDLARYERLRIAAARATAGRCGPAVALDPGVRPRLRPGVGRGAFEYDVLRIAADLERGRVPAADHRLDHELLLVPRPGASGPRIVRLNGAASGLLDLCDGQRSLAAIAAAYRGADVMRADEEEVGAALQRFVELGALDE